MTHLQTQTLVVDVQEALKIDHITGVDPNVMKIDVWKTKKKEKFVYNIDLVVYTHVILNICYKCTKRLTKLLSFLSKIF